MICRARSTVLCVFSGKNVMGFSTIRLVDLYMDILTEMQKTSRYGDSSSDIP